MKIPKENEIYVHFKGKDRKYEIVTVSKVNGKNFVWYKSLYEDEKKEIYLGQVFSRPLEEFCGDKKFYENYTNYDGKTFRKGEKVKRFTLISKNDLEGKIE